MLPISHLQSNTTFTVYMKGVTNDYETDEHVTTFKTAPPPPSAQISEVRTSSFKIEWTAVEGAMHYELEMFPSPAYANDQGIIVVSAARNNFLAQNLDPATDYQINLGKNMNKIDRVINIVSPTLSRIMLSPISYCQYVY